MCTEYFGYDCWIGVAVTADVFEGDRHLGGQEQNKEKFSRLSTTQVQRK